MERVQRWDLFVDKPVQLLTVTGCKDVSRFPSIILSAFAAPSAHRLIVVIVRVSISPCDCKSLFCHLPYSLTEGLALKCSVDDSEIEARRTGRGELWNPWGVGRT